MKIAIANFSRSVAARLCRYETDQRVDKGWQEGGGGGGEEERRGEGG